MSVEKLNNQSLEIMFLIIFFLLYSKVASSP